MKQQSGTADKIGMASAPTVIMGEVLPPARPPQPGGSGHVPNLKPGQPATNRAHFRIRIVQNAQRIWGPAVGELAADLLECLWRRQMPPSAVKLMLSKLLPDRLPPDVSCLPADLKTPADWLESVTKLRDMRRNQQITDDEWITLLQAETATWRVVQEANALIAAERR
jgi:hypothetical protein